MRWRRRGQPAEPPNFVDDNDRDRFRFEAIHRQFAARERAFVVVEAKLGAIALVALTLVVLYFPSDLNVADKVLAELLFASSIVALCGFRFFAGYEAFDVKTFAEGSRSDADVAAFTAKMVQASARNERAISMKNRLVLWALVPIVLVSACVPFTRHATRSATIVSEKDRRPVEPEPAGSFPPAWYTGSAGNP